MPAAPIILIADRHEDVVNSLKADLSATEFSLLHARDGKEALSILETAQPHIAAAVIELELPLVNGLDLIGRITSLEPKPKKIIATTYLEYEPLLELAKHMGADVIVRKRAPKETWIQTVRHLLPANGNKGEAGT